MRSVAILGPQGAGKSSIAALFEEHRGYQRHGIADAIKHLANLAYRQLGKDETLTVDRYSGLTVVTGRELLQDIGAALREVDRKFWLRVWRQDYFEIQRMGYGVVIDDVRLLARVLQVRQELLGPLILVPALHVDVRRAVGLSVGALLGNHVDLLDFSILGSVLDDAPDSLIADVREDVGDEEAGLVGGHFACCLLLVLLLFALNTFRTGGKK